MIRVVVISVVGIDVTVTGGAVVVANTVLTTVVGLGLVCNVVGEGLFIEALPAPPPRPSALREAETQARLEQP